MSDEWQTYVNDPRTICKYGAKCYQKNPEHHKAYKHPPKICKRKTGTGDKNRFSPYPRKNNSPQRVIKDTPTQENGDKEEITCNKDQKREDASTSNSNELKQKEEPTKTTIELPKKLSFYDKNTEKDIFKELFLTEMPADFFNFFDFLNKDESIEKTLSTVNLQLIGPYDLLLGKLPVLENKDLYLIHWRFFYDPPEFQAVLKKKGSSQYHIGYYRDCPNEKPAFLASNDSAQDYHITPVAENIFGAVYQFLQNEKKSPFTAVACQKLMNKIKDYAEEQNISLEEYNMKKRQSQIVSRTLHGAGIVVPYNKKTQLGYRRLVETDANIKKLFTKLEAAQTQDDKDKILSQLQPVITFASIAVDECDFGTGLEAGIDLFCSGLKELESSALSSLSAAYPLLNRESFKKIIQVHLKYRRKGPEVSLLSLSET